MWHSLKFFYRRASELARNGELADAVRSRLRASHANRRFEAQQSAPVRPSKSYSAKLPPGFGADRITLHLSVPPLPSRPLYAFTDHVTDASGNTTETVLAATTGGFAISRDLGKSWTAIPVKTHMHHRFIHVRSLGDGEYLAQTQPMEIAAEKNAPVDVLVLNERGDVLANHVKLGQRWHGCRAVDVAGDTLMYAEYASNMPVKGRRPFTCRVMRSRDRGRSWECVFERNGEQIRHFHFLQSRPGRPGEWWLTSGDLVHESRMWVSKDNGDNWKDITAALPDEFPVGGATANHKIFRTTDLKWIGDEVVWASDDYLMVMDPPGAKVFRGRATDPLRAELVGTGKWHFRSIVDIGDFLLLLSQRSNQPNPAPEEAKPGVYIMRKDGAGGLVHLFNLDSYPSRAKAGFTFSKASQAAKYGVFFSFRSSEEVFPAGHKILKWKVEIE